MGGCHPRNQTQVRFYGCNPWTFAVTFATRCIDGGCSFNKNFQELISWQVDGTRLRFTVHHHDPPDKFSEPPDVLGLFILFWNEWFFKWRFCKYYRRIFGNEVSTQNDEHLSRFIQPWRRH